MLKRLFACLLAGMVAAASAQQSVEAQVFANSVSEAGPPVVKYGHIFLSNRGPWRFVGAAFEHEGYATVHPFSLNGYGVFVLGLELPLNDGVKPRLQAVRYRMIIDGAWVSDPENPAWTSDLRGIRVSEYRLGSGEEPDARRFGVWNPGYLRDGKAHFFFKGAPGEYVTVVGDFSGWDPFIFQLIETSPGVYELVLELPPGDHVYAFYYRGDYVADPLNDRLLYGEGLAYSAFTLVAAR